MGGKSGGTTVGYWYELAIHFGLGIGPFDAYLEFRGGDKTAWAGSATHSQSIQINAPNLWGGEKDQGGIIGTLDLMFGEADQQPSPRLATIFGPQQPAWRGLATAAFVGKYGAMNPYPQPASHKICKIKAGWDGECWYPEKAEIASIPSIVEQPWVHLRMVIDGQDVYGFIGGKCVVTGALDFVPNGGSGGYTTVGRYRHTAPGANYSGFIDNVVVTKAVRATSDFVPPRDPPSAGSDPFWSDVIICLRGDGTDGSTSFADDKGNSWATLAAGITNSTEQAISGTGSIKVEGNGAISTPYSAGLNVGAHFTIDAWVRPDDLAGYVICVNQNDNLHAGYWLRLRPDGRLEIVVGRNTWPSTPAAFTSGAPVSTTPRWMNAAHILYYARTHSDIGRVPAVRMNDASYRAAADKLYAEGFGVCTSYDPSSESLYEFEQRICRLIGGSVSRSLIDGQYYLDLARGDYVLDELPVITDDDILDIKLQPSVPNGAINSVAVKYFDPERKESITTPPVQALSLIDAFGVISQINDYPEIPDGPLALRVAERDVRASTAPTRTMELTLIPDAAQGVRPNQYFRLQSVKRRIADMVCLMGDRQAGTLKSGAVRITATEDIYSLPATSFAEIEPGVDTRPDPTPNPITLQAAFEAPYIELVQRLDRANLDVLPADAGYLLAIADQPPGGRSYSLAVAAAGGEFEVSATGDWCPFATVAGDAATRYGPDATSIPIRAIQRGDQLVIGGAGLWDSEVVRIDDIDIVADAVILGRGCADTVAVEHAGGSLLWLYDAAAVSDLVEYTDGEIIDVKLLTNTGSAQLAPGAAALMTVEFAGRQARPYPPAAPRLNGEAWPEEVFETADVSWLHRDRVAQADQLVDQQMASIGPEPGTTYTVRWFLDGTLAHAEAGITGTTASYAPTADGALRVEVEAVRDGLVSWQRQAIECTYRVHRYSTYINQAGDTYVDQDGNHFIG